MTQDLGHDAAEQTPVTLSGNDGLIIKKLNHLFRKAGDAPEMRLIYQAVLKFHQNNTPA